MALTAKRPGPMSNQMLLSPRAMQETFSWPFLTQTGKVGLSLCSCSAQRMFTMSLTFILSRQVGPTTGQLMDVYHFFFQISLPFLFFSQVSDSSILLPNPSGAQHTFKNILSVKALVRHTEYESQHGARGTLNSLNSLYSNQMTTII